MRSITTEIYQFAELSNEAKQVALDNYRNKEHDFTEWAIDDCSLLEPAHDELVNLFGLDYKFPLIKNNRTDIRFDIDYHDFLDCSKAIEITNDDQFLAWLGITDEFLLQKIYYKINTPNSKYSNTCIEFDSDSSFDRLTDEERSTLRSATNKFSDHIQAVLKRIKMNIDYRYLDESIIEDFTNNQCEFLDNGTETFL